MKNKLIFLIVIISSLFFINNASAKELYIDYDHEKMQLLEEHKDVVDKLIEIANTSNENGYSYVINFGYVSGSRIYSKDAFKDTDLYNTYIDDYVINIGITGAKNNYFGFGPRYSGGTYPYIYNETSLKGDNLEILPPLVTGKYSFSDNFSIAFSQIDDPDYLNKFYDVVKKTFANGCNNLNGLSNSYSKMNPKRDSSDSNKYPLLENNVFVVLLYSNLPIKYIQSSSSCNDTLTINDKTYNYNDYIPTYYDYKYSKPKTPTATFEIIDTDTFTNSNDETFVIEKKITINFSDFDTSKYIYKYAIDDTENFITLSHTVNKKFSFKTRKNCVVYVKIIDKDTGTDVFNGSLNILSISKPIPVANLVLLEEKHYDNNDKLPVMYRFYSLHFDYFNTDMYEYQYYDNYIDIPNVVEENDYRVAFFDNYSLPVWVFDKETGEQVAYYEFYVNDIVSQDYPISFFEVFPLEVSCGNGNETYIYKKEVYIHFSRILVDEFSYQYQFSNEDQWHDERELNDFHEFFIELYHNATIRVRILDKETGSIVHANTLNIIGIEENSNIDGCLSDLDDYFDYMNNISSQNGEDSNGRFFANLLSIAYNTAPHYLAFLFRMFLILTFVSIVIFLLLR